MIFERSGESSWPHSRVVRFNTFYLEFIRIMPSWCYFIVYFGLARNFNTDQYFIDFAVVGECRNGDLVRGAVSFPTSVWKRTGAELLSNFQLTTTSSSQVLKTASSHQLVTRMIKTTSGCFDWVVEVTKVGQQIIDSNVGPFQPHPTMWNHTGSVFAVCFPSLNYPPHRKTWVKPMSGYYIRNHDLKILRDNPTSKSFPRNQEREVGYSRTIWLEKYPASLPQWNHSGGDISWMASPLLEIRKTSPVRQRSHGLSKQNYFHLTS